MIKTKLWIASRAFTPCTSHFHHREVENDVRYWFYAVVPLAWIYTEFCTRSFYIGVSWMLAERFGCSRGVSRGRLSRDASKSKNTLRVFKRLLHDTASYRHADNYLPSPARSPKYQSRLIWSGSDSTRHKDTQMTRSHSCTVDHKTAQSPEREPITLTTEL